LLSASTIGYQPFSLRQLLTAQTITAALHAVCMQQGRVPLCTTNWLELKSVMLSLALVVLKDKLAVLDPGLESLVLVPWP